MTVSPPSTSKAVDVGRTCRMVYLGVNPLKLNDMRTSLAPLAEQVQQSERTAPPR